MIELCDSEIHLWFANHEHFDDVRLRKQCLSWLTENEMCRLNRYSFKRHRKQFLLGRMLIRNALSQYSDVDPQDWEFTENEYGKPILESKHHQSLFFNLSHSANCLVVAISRVSQLGVDIELSDKLRRVIKIGARYFSNSEIKELSSLPESQQLSRFYDLWTLKEAYIKARGFGMLIRLQQFTFTFSEHSLSIRFEKNINDDPSNWQMWQINKLGPFKLALAIKSEHEITKIESRRFIALDQVACEQTSIIRRLYR